MPHYLNVSAARASFHPLKSFTPSINLILSFNPICIFFVSHSFFCALAAILSALRNLQEKIRRLELEKEHTKFSLRTSGKHTSHTLHQSESDAQRHVNDQKDREIKTNGQSNCNQGEHVHTRIRFF